MEEGRGRGRPAGNDAGIVSPSAWQSCDGQRPSETRESPRERGQEGQHGQPYERHADALAPEDGVGVRDGVRAAIGRSLPAPPIAGRAHARIITRIILIRVIALTACG